MLSLCGSQADISNRAIGLSQLFIGGRPQSEGDGPPRSSHVHGQAAAWRLGVQRWCHDFVEVAHEESEARQEVVPPEVLSLHRVPAEVRPCVREAFNGRGIVTLKPCPDSIGYIVVTVSKARFHPIES